MKITDIWKAAEKPTISFELFPARSPKGAESLEKAIDALAALEPDFFAVTFGAGGSTREGSRRLIETLKTAKGREVIAYFAGYGLGPDDVIDVLDGYRDLGLENILVVRGDPPRELEGFTPHPESFAYASDLMGFVRPRYDLCLGVAGYPEGHIEAEDEEKDIEFLKRKVDGGADYIITNYFYDNRFFFDFVERCKAAGIEVPILPGVMPIYSVKMMKMLAGLCGATITDAVTRGLDALPEGDTEALARFGIDFALDQCRALIEAGVPGLHVYTMDRSRATVAVVNALREEGLL